MMPAMMLALALWAPLTPATDQAVLTGLFRRGVPARVGVETPEQIATMRDWMGAGCHSNFAVRISASKTLRTAIDWSARDRGDIEIRQSGRRVVLNGGYSVQTDIDGLQFRFATVDKARRAALAFRRLQAACGPQR